MNELTFTRGLPGLGGAWLRDNGDVILLPAVGGWIEEKLGFFGVFTF